MPKFQMEFNEIEITAADRSNRDSCLPSNQFKLCILLYSFWKRYKSKYDILGL